MDNQEEGSGRVRLSFVVSADTNTLLDELAVRMGSTSKSEVLRRAIGLMEVAVEAKEQGQKLYVSDPWTRSPSDGDVSTQPYPMPIKEIVGI